MNDIILKSDPDFRYNLLARLKSDCEYYLGAGSRYDGHLWSGNPEQQIKDMRALYESFPDEDKPEWITEQQIESFQNQMISANDYNDNRCPDREEVETAHNNLLAEMSINRHEEEYGADGERNFPYLNDPSPTEADYRNVRHRGR